MKRIDAWTAAAIAIVAYIVSIVLHEGVGHGGACLLVGGKPLFFNAIYFDCETTTDGARRIVAAGGSVVAVLLGFALLGALRLNVRASVRYAIWLLATLQLLSAFGYLLFSGIGKLGDWARVIEGWPHEGLLRVVEVVLGGGLYFVVAPKLLWPTFARWLSGDRVRRARTLSVLPYVVGGLTYVAAGVLNPHGVQYVLLSAAGSSFGGASLLAWFFTLRAKNTTGDGDLDLPRSLGWMVAAAVSLAIFVGVLGPGIALH